MTDEANDVSAEDDATTDEVNDLAWPIPVQAMAPLALIFCGVLIWAFGIDWVLAPLLPFAAMLGVMTVIDLRELRIPDKLTRPSLVLVVPLLAIGLLSAYPELSLVRAVLGGAAMFAFYFILLLIYPMGMGWGDVKLAPIIGAVLGFFSWAALVRGLILAYLVVGPVAIVLLLARKANRKTGLPFGPFMGLGAVVALVLEAKGF